MEEQSSRGYKFEDREIRFRLAENLACTRSEGKLGESRVPKNLAVLRPCGTNRCASGSQSSSLSPTVVARPPPNLLFEREFDIYSPLFVYHFHHFPTPHVCTLRRETEAPFVHEKDEELCDFKQLRSNLQSPLN